MHHIVRWFEYNNIGDELIVYSLLSYLRDECLDIVVVSASPQQTKRIHGIDSIPIDWSVLENLRVSENVIFGGG